MEHSSVRKALHRHADIVIIGSGIAGLSAAEAARKQDEQCSLLLIGKETYLPYYRVRLSKYLNKDFNPEEIFIHPASWYEERNISILPGVSAVGISSEDRQVILSNGERISYGKLILAQGSSSFIPPFSGSESSGVFSVRTMEDVFSIQQQAIDGRKVVIAGGGLLGLEIAWALRDRGMEVSVVEYFPYLLPKQAGKDGSRVIEKIVMDHGIKLYLNASIIEIKEKAEEKTVYLSSGTSLDASFVIFSIGITPNTSIIQGTGITVDRGILVNERMETNVDGIYCAGDAAQYNGKVWGLWTVAQEQGKVAGANAAGGQVDYQEVFPSPVLRIGNVSVFSTGNISDHPEYDVMTDESEMDRYHYKKINIKDGKIIGGILIGNISKGPRLRTAIQQGKSIKDLLEKHASLDEILEQI